MDTPCGNNPLEYCVGRMVGKVGIIRIGMMISLSAAQARMKELTEACPGQYIVFCRSTGRVVAQTDS
jgi:hypothetical protein